MSLPNLSPDQVVALQDALLANADSLLGAALLVLDGGSIALARSLAILGLEESGKAIGVHERRVEIVRMPGGDPFRCTWLDELWASHAKKLEKVYRFLVDEQYYFAAELPSADLNAAYLGTIKEWITRHNHLKQGGFYVDLSMSGDPLSPARFSDEGSLRDVISHVHQIGWQLRLGEHIEGKLQDEQEAGFPASDADLSWLDSPRVRADPELVRLLTEPRAAVPGVPLNNAAYRFNRPDCDRSPFRNWGKPGYEAEDRELILLAGSPEAAQASVDAWQRRGAELDSD